MFIELTDTQMLDLFYQVLLAKQESFETFATLNECVRDPQLTLDLILDQWVKKGLPVEGGIPKQFQGEYQFFFDLVNKTLQQAIDHGGLIRIMEEVD